MSDAIGSLLDFEESAVVQEPPYDCRKDFSVRIESFSVSDVREFDKIRFNTNNHHNYCVDPDNALALVRRESGGERSAAEVADYEAVLEQCQTCHWIDAFHASYRVVNLSRRHLPWMQKASVLACQVAGLSRTYADDVEDAVATTDVGDTFVNCALSRPESGYFVRTETVSLKDGVHGVGPYFSLKAIIESSITARLGHQGIDGRSRSIKYYLFPWRPQVTQAREFRVFVRCGRVTAVSQQSLYNANPVLSLFADDETKRSKIIHNWCRRLMPYIYDTVIPRLDHVRSFVMDIVLLTPAGSDHSDCSDGAVDLNHPEQLTPYFIEINPFGFQYSSGSSLFSWIEDYAVLYGLDTSFTNTVAFRYTRRE